MSGRILVVEDEPAISDAVAYALREAGYDVDGVDDGNTAIAAARDQRYDLMVLDLVLPGRPGLDVCRTLRAESDLPIVILTGRDAERDRIVGLETGADDYLTKPFSTAELVSRVRALLRRRELDRNDGAAVQKVGGLHLDSRGHAASVDGRAVPPPSSFARLTSRHRAPGTPQTREELADDLREEATSVATGARSTHVRTRDESPSRPRSPRRLVVRGVGYMLIVRPLARLRRSRRASATRAAIGLQRGSGTQQSGRRSHRDQPSGAEYRPGHAIVWSRNADRVAGRRIPRSNRAVFRMYDVVRVDWRTLVIGPTPGHDAICFAVSVCYHGQSGRTRR
jgi:DNA-binding response OmpR family regulator